MKKKSVSPEREQELNMLEVCKICKSEIWENVLVNEEEVEEEEGEEEEEEEGEGRRPKVKKNPKLPSESEVEEHYATNHVPFRNWCKVCIMAKAVNSGHRKLKSEEEQLITTVSMDYGCMVPEEESDGYMPILVMHDRESGKINANIVPTKEVNPYSVKKVAQNICLLGYTKIILKCDEEPGIVALRTAVKAELSEHHKIEVIPEDVPVGESQANGEVENAVRMVKA